LERIMIRKPKPWILAMAAAAGIAVVQSLLAVWFAWPAQNPAPRELPVVVAGPQPATSALASNLRAGNNGTFDITIMADATAADEALRQRDAYAAFIVDATGVTVHTASAASPTVATMISQAAQAMAGTKQQKVMVVDVIPTPPDDPRGAGFVSGFLPMLITSIACGLVLLFGVTAFRVRLLGLASFAIFAGAIVTGLLHARGILTGPYLPAAGVVALLTLAISSLVCGLGASLGYPGAVLGAATVFFLGNPISGLTTAPELLPTPWGTIGQFLPPGAGASLLRSVAFFDGAQATQPLLVLSAWVLVGVVGLGKLKAAYRRG
jgi:hypothetical protein